MKTDRQLIEALLSNNGEYANNKGTVEEVLQMHRLQSKGIAFIKDGKCKIFNEDKAMEYLKSYEDRRQS